MAMLSETTTSRTPAQSARMLGTQRPTKTP